MLIVDRAHRESADCVRALEQEIRRLQELLELVNRLKQDGHDNDRHH
jgi:hypothetical protein